jgi:hypothetical protein
MDPIGIIFGIVAFGIAHVPGMPTDTRYEASCWDTLSWYHCHQQNFGNIHTDAYKAAIRAGHNIKVR